MTRRTFFIESTAVLAAFALRWLGGGGKAEAGAVTMDEIGDQLQTLPRGTLPEFAKTIDAQRLYRYAVEHGDELQYIPCFCGCYRFGHKSNRDCYIKAFKNRRPAHLH